jgi:Protein of unknown function (DUF2934)
MNNKSNKLRQTDWDERRPVAESRQDNHEEIAVLAFARWRNRGCPEGSADEDWRWAEEQIGAQDESGGAIAA